MGSAGRMLDTMGVAILFFALLAAFAVGDDPCDSTAPPEPAPAPSPAPTPAPSPAPTPGCADKPGDWKSSIGSTCADYVSKSYCTTDGGSGSFWVSWPSVACWRSAEEGWQLAWVARKRKRNRRGRRVSASPLLHLWNCP